MGAVMLPVLSRGLNDKSEEVKRTCCQIVDNMCKVVEDPAAVLPVLPKLEPLVKAATEKISDPEARGMAERALKTSQKSAQGAETKDIKPSDAIEIFKEALGDQLADDEVSKAVLVHVGALVLEFRRCGTADWVRR